MHVERESTDGMPRGREQVAAALIASATRLFARRGVQGASVREIAADAGVNHALVFRHFGSKEKLARAVLDHLLDDLVQQFRGVGVDPAALAALGEAVADRQDLWKLLTRAVLDGEIDFLTERSFPEIEHVLVAMAEAHRRGGLRGPEDPRTLLLIVLSGVLGWVLLDPLLVGIVGTPGRTPERRRELARAAFAELLGVLPAGATVLSETEAREAWVATEVAPAGLATGNPRAAWPKEARPQGRKHVSDALVQAAMALFAERGPAAVSVREIAAEAGVNHALVFRHFGSKEGLVQAVWERMAQDLAGHVLGAPDYAGVTALTEALAESEVTWRLLARAIVDDEISTLAAHPYRFVKVMVWGAARGQETGAVEARIHPRLIVSMVLAMGLGWLVFHPVLVPLIGMSERDPRRQRRALREAVVDLLGWRVTRSGGDDSGGASG